MTTNVTTEHRVLRAWPETPAVASVLADYPRGRPAAHSEIREALVSRGIIPAEWATRPDVNWGPERAPPAMSAIAALTLANDPHRVQTVEMLLPALLGTEQRFFWAPFGKLPLHRARDGNSPLYIGEFGSTDIQVRMPQLMGANDVHELLENYVVAHRSRWKPLLDLGVMPWLVTTTYPRTCLGDRLRIWSTTPSLDMCMLVCSTNPEALCIEYTQYNRLPFSSPYLPL